MLVRVLAIVAVVAVGLLVVSNQVRLSTAATTSAPSDPQCSNGKGPCPNVACVSGCWSDGTYENRGTMAVQKAFAPVECGLGAKGCVTQSCH
jgi:hypothetical protein